MEQLFFQMLAYPCRVLSEINYRPHHGALVLQRAEDAIRKDLAQQAMVVMVNHPVGANGYFQLFDVGPKASREIIT